MRRFSIMSFACVVVLVALAAGTGYPIIIENDTYYWPPGTVEGTCDLKVEEDVYYIDYELSDPADALNWVYLTPGDPDGKYLYRYTVTRVNWTEGVTEWGYAMPGIGFEYANSPVGWAPGGPAGTDVGWYDTDVDPNGPIVDALDSFMIWSDAAPFVLYAGTATGTDEGTVTGEVSGPTPEPITMALLALGLPLGLLASRRRKED